MRRMVVMIALCLVAACGKGPAAPRPVDERGGEPGEAEAAGDTGVLRVLELAVRDDDGAALDALIHPTLGMWVWDQPGAYVIPNVHLVAGAATPPSKRWKPEDDLNAYWREELWNHVHQHLARGLGALDRDPADRHAAVYGTCDDFETHGDLRAWITTEDLGPHYVDIAVEAKVQLTALQTETLVHYHQWGLDVWLMRDRGRLWVAHVMVWTPCDA